MAAAAFQKLSFCKFLTQFYPISGPLIAFLWVAAKINNKDILKLCRKITKITDPNFVFFLGDGTNPRMKFPAEYLKLWTIFIGRNCLVSIIIIRNCLLSIIIDMKNYQFLPKCMKSKRGPLCQLRLPFLRRGHTLLCLFTHTLSNNIEFLRSVPGSQTPLEHVSIKT